MFRGGPLLSGFTVLVFFAAVSAVFYYWRKVIASHLNAVSHLCLFFKAKTAARFVFFNISIFLPLPISIGYYCSLVDWL